MELEPPFPPRETLEKNNPDFIHRLFDALPDPFFVKDSDLRTVYVNPAFCKFVGQPAEAIVGKLDAEYAPDPATDFFRKQDELVLRTRTPLESEESFEDETGLHLLHVRKICLRFPDGQDYVVGSMRDMIDFRLAEVRRHETEQQLNGVVEMIEETIWSSDAETLETLYLSPSAERMYGRSLPELYRNETWAEMVPHADLLRIFAAFEKVKNGKTDIVDFRIHHRTLGERTIQMKAHGLRDASGKVRRIQGISTDITELLRTQAELAEHQQKLVAAAKMNTLGELASWIGHEINTPLSGIMSKIARLEMMIDRNEIDLEKAKRFCTDANGLVQKVADIIQGLKDLSIEKVGEELSQFDPLTALNQALSLTRARFSNQGVVLQLENRLPPGQQAYGIPTYLFQAIVNLLNNSFDALVGPGFAGRGEKVVRILLEKRDSELTISVADNGSGVAQEILPKLFEPFQTTKILSNGSGLGLSISRRLMRQIAGDLIHEANAPLTTFIISMPITRS